MEKKVLVCITPQSNSVRLIDKGSEIIDAAGGGDLFILHIQRGDNIFASDGTGQLLQELFEYGKKKGGAVHALSGNDVISTIKKFALEHKISDIVLGEPPADIMGKSEVVENVGQMLPYIKVSILERNK